MLHILGRPKTFECIAEGGRPTGEFQWRIGDKNDPKGMDILTNSNPANIQPDGNGYFVVSEVTSYFFDLGYTVTNLELFILSSL